MRIVVSGMLAGTPGQGGASWAVLQYVLGLRRLGHDVRFVETVDDLARSAAYFQRVRDAFGLDGALVERGTGETLGEPARGGDLLLNISGLLAQDDLLAEIPVRAFVDLDPAFTQLWADACDVDLGFDRHNRFVTIGRGIADGSSGLPTCGRNWIQTRQPIVLERWPVADRVVHDAATTVAHWRSYGSITHRGVHYGQKAHAMRALFDLTGRTGKELAVALAIHEEERDDLEALRRNRWRLLDPSVVAATPWDYQAFVQGSWAELGVAKHGYVASRCGWFSDRSVCYLASGRPVVAQDTGFGDWLPVGEGLLSFADSAGAAAALDAVALDYPRHRRAARGIAEEYFDSDRVLKELLACL